MSDLTDLRGHAFDRANWQPGKPKMPCRDRTAFGTPKPADHANCGGGTCGCECHAPTDYERAMWRQIYAEIDGYLARNDDDGQGSLL